MTLSGPSQSQDGKGTLPPAEQGRSAPNSIIPIKDLEELQLIAQMVGGKFGMQVRVGEAGQGSFFDTEIKTVTLDPIHIRDKPSFAKFVAAHEGGHAAIMKSLKELGLSEEEIERLYSQIGFGFSLNVTEDGADNDWTVRTMPGLEKDFDSAYEEMFSKDGTVLSTPEVQHYARQLGRWPKFAQYGSEILRDWHMWRREIGYKADFESQAVEGRFSQSLDKDVEAALKKTIRAARRSISAIPPAGCRDDDVIVEKHKERFRITSEEVYPEVAKLVKIDFGIETARQALNDFQKMLKELAQKEQELAGAQQAGQPGAAEKIQQEIEQLQDQLKPYTDMAAQARQEIEQAIKQAIEQSIKDFADDVKGDADALKQSKAKEQELNEQISSQGLENEELNQKQEELRQEQIKAQQIKKALDQKIQDALGDSQAAQDLKDAIDQEVSAGTEQAPGEGSEQQGAQAGSSAGQAGASGGDFSDSSMQESVSKEMSERVEDSGEKPLPYDELSQESQKEIDKMLDGMEDEHYDDVSDRATETLENFEDAANNEISSKLNQSDGVSHSEQKESEQAGDSSNSADQDGDSSESSQESQASESSPSDSSEGGQGAYSNTGASQVDLTPTETSEQDAANDSAPTPSSSDASQRDLKDAERVFKEQLDQVELARKGMLSNWDTARELIHPEVSPVKVRIRNAWKRSEKRQVIKHQKRGRLNLRRAREAERDQRKMPTVFDQRLDPKHQDFSRITLIDRSGSMKGDKASASFTGSVFMIELDRALKIKDAAYAFPGQAESGMDWSRPAVELLKDFNESASDTEVQERIAGVLDTGGGTPDAEALFQVYEIIKDRPEKYKIIDVVSDSGSNAASDLRQVLEYIQKEGKVLVIHYGLGPGTKDQNGVYPMSFGNLRVERTRAGASRTGRTSNFIEVYARVNERVLKYPERALKNPKEFVEKELADLIG